MKPIQTTAPTKQPFSPAPVAMNRRVALIVRDVTNTTNQPRELKEVVIRPGSEEGLTSIPVRLVTEATHCRHTA